MKTNIPLSVVFLTAAVSSTNYNIVHNLTDTLLNGYNKMVRGSKDMTGKTTVRFTFQIVNIVEFDERNGKLEITGFFFLQWNDYRMTWDPDQYNTTTSVMFVTEDVWTPNIILSSAHSDFRGLGVKELPIRFDNTGNSYWYPADVFKTACTPDIYYYPYDTQICDIFFSFWGYGVNEVSFQPFIDEVNRYVYTEHGLWNLTESSVGAIEDERANLIFLYIQLKLTRMPEFYLINMILPVMTIGMLNILVFLLPAESGERVGFSITVLLAIAVFQTIASEKLPAISRPQVSLLCIKLLVDLCLSVLVTTLAIVSLYFYDMSDSRKVPDCLRAICNVILCKKCEKDKEKDKEGYQEEETYKIYQIIDGQQITASISISDNHSSNDEGSKCTDITWVDIGRCSDIVFAVFSILAFIASNVVFAVLAM